MTGEAVVFAALAVGLLGASLLTVLARNLFHSVLWLALALVATAGLFLLLRAEFLAAVQVLLYAGGVVTLVVFAIMLTERLAGATISQMNRGLVGGALGAVALFVATVAVLGRTTWPPTRPATDHAGTAVLGRALLTEWVLPFEGLAILFLAALLGALYLARPED